MIRKISLEIKKYKVLYILLSVVLAFGLFIRIYRVDQILGFYFDQGRDALVIWDLWHDGKFFLIGPTTGIAGIFRGPLYYYLIAPFYLIGGGNPVWPAIFLALLSMVAVFVLFILGARIYDRTTGLFAATLASASFYIMLASRWLSNPTPMLLLSVLLLWSMILVSQGRRWAWVLISLFSGLSLFHFGSSGEFFYFPAILIFMIWKRKFLPTVKIFLICVFIFFLTAAPLIFFDLRHDHLLLNNLKKFFVDDQSFKASFWDVAKIRLTFYYDVFSSKIFHWRRTREIALLASVSVAFVIFLPTILKKTEVKILLLLLISPLIGLLFFQGNFGNIYDYYLTGYYLLFILLFGITLGRIWKFKLGKLFIIYFLYVFLTVNWDVDRYYIISGVDGENTVAFGNQKQAMDWIYNDALKEGKKFNIDYYVPPVIPYTYEYLSKWYGTRYYSLSQDDQNVDLLYTLYEVDPPHPERLDAWMKRQSGIGKVLEEEVFGGITVQRRQRI